MERTELLSNSHFVDGLSQRESRALERIILSLLRPDLGLRALHVALATSRQHRK